MEIFFLDNLGVDFSLDFDLEFFIFGDFRLILFCCYLEFVFILVEFKRLFL
jgi:hypothetical protein